MSIHDIVTKLRQEKVRLERQTEKVNEALVALGSLGGKTGRIVSASARRRMSLAQKARWKKRRAAKKAVAQMK